MIIGYLDPWGLVQVQGFGSRVYIGFFGFLGAVRIDGEGAVSVSGRFV